MKYELQPGTTPFRAVAWLRSMAKVRPNYEPSTVEVCEALDVDVDGFTACMANARYHGLVKTSRRVGAGKVLFWSLGDGARTDDIRSVKKEAPLHPRFEVDLSAMRAPLLPELAGPPPGFRAMPWDGNLLVTGMEVRDGVAIFTPEMVMGLKQHTDWWLQA